MTVRQLKAEMDQLILEGHGRLKIVSLAEQPSIMFSNRRNMLPNLKGKTALLTEMGKTVVLLV